MAQHRETRRWSVRCAQDRGNPVIFVIVKRQGFFHGMVFQSQRGDRRLVGRANSEGPGKFCRKEGQAAKEQADGDPGRDLNRERTEREVPGHRSEHAEAHRSQAQSSQLNGSPPVHDGCELLSIGLLFFPARDSAGRQHFRNAIGQGPEDSLQDKADHGYVGIGREVQ